MNMRRFVFIMALTLGCGPALAAHVIQYGNRAGEVADITSTSGLSTAHAFLRAHITRANAAAYCREQNEKPIPKCIAINLSYPLKHPLTANCPARTFTDFQGDHWRFVGPRANDDGMAKFRLLHSETGEEADGSMASNYDLSLGIFRALCPKQAPQKSAGE